MSYILDALKKAERERGLSDETRHAVVHLHPKRYNFKLRAVWVIICLCLPAAVWVYFSKVKKDVRQPAPEAIAAFRSAVQSPLAPMLAWVPSQPKQSSKPPELTKKPTAKEPNATVARPLSVAHSNPAAQVILTNPMPPASSEGGTVTPLRIPAPKAEPSPVINTNSVSLIDAMAKMSMSVHLYSENKTERLVFINGKICHEGESLGPGIILESITPEGAILRSEEERAVLRLGSR